MKKLKEHPAAEVAYDALKEEYLGEERRLNLLVSKAQTLAQVESVTFVAFGFSNLLTKQCAQDLNRLAVATGLVSVLLCTYILMTATFQRPKYSGLLEDVKNFATKNKVQYMMAQTYRTALERSASVADKKMAVFNWAVYLAMASCVIELLAICTQHFRACP